MNKNVNSLLINLTYKVATAVAIGLFLVSCDRQIEEQFPVSEGSEDIEIDFNPFNALQKIIELTTESRVIIENVDDKSEEEIESSEPISFRELLEYLPPTPVGWSAEKPQGQTNSWGDYRISQVKQTYFNGDKQMTVSIFDWALNSALYMPFLLSTEFSHESTEGYSKGVKIDNIPGREEYDYQTKDGSLNLLINRRFLVQIDGNNIEESELREWWQKMKHLNSQ